MKSNFNHKSARFLMLVVSQSIRSETLAFYRMNVNGRIENKVIVQLQGGFLEKRGHVLVTCPLIFYPLVTERLQNKVFLKKIILSQVKLEMLNGHLL